MNLKISEIFDSIQGEGPNVGTPAIFVRTALCNLACSWCDTKYTWDWKNYDYKKEVSEMQVSDVRNEITKYDRDHLVITGGEPLLQQDGLVELLEDLGTSSYFVEIETNGTIKPTNGILKYVNQWNVSPKLSNSDNKRDAYEKKECYQFFRQLSNSFFKYVIQNENDIEEVEYFIQKYNLPKERVLLMPQGSDKDDILLHIPMVKELGKQHHLSYSPRLHIELWGNRRGK